MKKGKCNTLIFFTLGYPSKAHSEPYIFEEMKYLSKIFNKIIVIPVSANNNGEFYETPKNVEVVFVINDKVNSVAALFYTINILMSDLFGILNLKKPLQMLRYYKAYVGSKVYAAFDIEKQLNLTKLLQECNPIFYSYWLSEPALIASVLKKKHPMIPFVSRAHGYDVFEDQTHHNFIPFKKYKLKQLNAVFSVSKKGQQHLQKQLPMYRDKIGLAYLGTADHGMGPFETSEEFNIVSCSKVRDIKRLDLMPAILKNLKLNITWHVLGDGPGLGKLKDACTKLPSNIKVVFHGFLSQEDLISFYKSNSVNLFISLSSSEGLPVSMMEATSFGVPLMSTDVGGCSEVCNENTGFLIPKSFDAQTIAQEIRSFRDSNKNTFQFRSGVRMFWEKHFCAEKNYRDFHKILIHESDKKSTTV